MKIIKIFFLFINSLIQNIIKILIKMNKSNLNKLEYNFSINIDNSIYL